MVHPVGAAMSSQPPARRDDSHASRGSHGAGATAGTIPPTMTPLRHENAPPVRMRRTLDTEDSVRPPVIVRSAGGSARRMQLNRTADDGTPEEEVQALRDAARRERERAEQENTGPGLLTIVLGTTVGSFVVVAVLAGWLLQ